MSDKLLKKAKHFKSICFEERKEFFEKLSTAQDPEVLFVTCADSRLHPHMFTESDAGELFICRNAGNIVPPHDAPPDTTSASIEYALHNLDLTDIVICGHSDCGAMKALLNPESTKDMPNMRHALRYANTALQALEDADVSSGEMLQQLTEMNVLLQMVHLRSHPFVAEAEKAGRLSLHGWVYNIGEGNIRVFSPEENTFSDL